MKLSDEFVTIQVWNSSVKYPFRLVARHIWQPDIAENNKILLNGAFKNSSAFFCMSQHRKQNLCIEVLRCVSTMPNMHIWTGTDVM